MFDRQPNASKGVLPAMEPILPVCQDETELPIWLAAYTTPRHEKSVVRHLEVRDVEYFLPLYKAASTKGDPPALPGRQ